MAIYRKGEDQFQLRRDAFFTDRAHEDTDEGASYNLGRYNKGIDTISYGVSGDDLARGIEDAPVERKK